MPRTRLALAGLAVLIGATLFSEIPAVVRAQAEAPFGALPDPGNVFISPCGRAFRARTGEPYPVADWFRMADLNEDGKLDKAEFMADTLAFFKILDRNADGVISPEEVSFYEQRLAPEVLGMKVEVRGGVLTPVRPALQTVQGMGGMGGMGGGMGGMGGVDPGGGSGSESSQKSRPYDASGAGASPYSFFDEPEPVTAADIHYRGVITRADFLRLAEIHYAALDRAGVGYLTLANLPRTPVQRRLDGHGRRGRRS